MKEIINYKIDILGLCEMRWTGSDKMKEDGKTIIYSGHSDKHILGVGLCLSLPVAKSLISWKPVNEHIITARFQTRHAKVTIIQAHAPAMEADDNKKNNFYKSLQNIINKVLRHDIKLLMEELNAQIDKSRQGMESTIGPHGSANITNNNGERFTLLCSVNEIRIGNTFFKHKDIHKTIWSLLTITQRMKLIIFPLVVDGVNHYKDVRVIEVLIGRDHFFLIGKMRLKFKRPKQAEKQLIFDTPKLKLLTLDLRINWKYVTGLDL